MSAGDFPRSPSSSPAEETAAQPAPSATAIATAIATDNGELAADAARRIANHRLPRGGLLPYLPFDKITTQGLSVLPAMEAAVEGGARQLAAAAESGDMAAAAQHFGTVSAGCGACHAHFRGQPGTSPRVRPR